MLRSLMLPLTVPLLAVCNGGELNFYTGVAAPDFSSVRLGGSTLRFPNNSCNRLVIPVTGLTGILTARGARNLASARKLGVFASFATCFICTEGIIDAHVVEEAGEATFDRIAGDPPQ